MNPSESAEKMQRVGWQSMPKIEDEIEPNIEFWNPHVKEIPPARKYFYLEHSGDQRGHPFSVTLNKITMDELRENYKNRKIDMPLLQGNWELMNHWITNMWEAVYNPIWQLQLHPGKDRKYAVISGQHRLRLLDAMDVNHIWFYDVEYPDYVPFRWRIGRRDLPPDLQRIVSKNERPPRKGTMSGTCEHCGQHTSWKKRTIGSKLDGVHMYCKKCGEENPYPWPGRL